MKNIVLRLIDYKEKHPYRMLIIIAILIRIVAVIWSKGFMIFDDHYLIIEPAGGWVGGVDVQNWLPGNEAGKGPHFMSFFYVGIIWFLFEIMELIGLENPENQMFVLRVLHGAFSLLVVTYGYKISLKLSNKYSAFQVGIILALLAFIPTFSVKQLIEMVCIPPLMGSYYYLIKDGGLPKVKNIIIAGIWAGIAVGIRYQVGVIYVGIGVVLLFEKQFRTLIILSTVAFFTFFITQISDLFLWQEPFAQLRSYIDHNTTYHNDYVSAPWYRYIFTLVGFLIPPISFFLLFGFFRNWKKYILFVLPVLLFLVFHSMYPNKQERFILPIIPLIITIGVIGWHQWLSVSRFWLKYYRLNRLAWIFFWIVNTMVLVVFSTAYTKRQIVEPMSILERRGDAGFLFLEDSYSDKGYIMYTKYYLNNWEVPMHTFVSKTNRDAINRSYKSQNIEGTTYIFFYDDLHLQKRIDLFEKEYSEIELVEEVSPGSLDLILYTLNPHNKAHSTFIYKVKK